MSAPSYRGLLDMPHMPLAPCNWISTTTDDMPPDETDGSRVVVASVRPPNKRAADLRRRLTTVQEDWDRLEPTVYDSSETHL